MASFSFASVAAMSPPDKPCKMIIQPLDGASPSDPTISAAITSADLPITFTLVTGCTSTGAGSTPLSTVILMFTSFLEARGLQHTKAGDAKPRHANPQPAARQAQVDHTCLLSFGFFLALAGGMAQVARFLACCCKFPSLYYPFSSESGS